MAVSPVEGPSFSNPAKRGTPFCKACLPRPRSINSAGPGPVGRGGQEGFGLQRSYDCGLINTNAINNFTVPVGCVPRTHRLIGVIGDHALQGCNGIKCVCISK